MNVKLDGKGLRFKISADELKQLQDKKPLLETLTIGRRKLAITIDPGGVSDELVPAYDEDTIRLLVSPAKIQELAALGRSREGLEQITDNFTVSLQVDFRTQKRQAA